MIVRARMLSDASVASSRTRSSSRRCGDRTTCPKSRRGCTEWAAASALPSTKRARAQRLGVIRSVERSLWNASCSASRTARMPVRDNEDVRAAMKISRTGVPGRSSRRTGGSVRRPDEVGQDPHRPSSGDQPHLSGQIGDLEPDVGFEAGCAALLHGPLPRGGPGGLHDPGAALEITQAPGRIFWRQCQADRVASQHLAFESGAVRTGVPRVLLGDHEVETAGGELEQALFGRNLGDLDAQAGLAVRHQRQRTREDRLGRGLEHRDAHGRDAGLEGFEGLAPDLLLEFERPRGVRRERDAVLGQPHPATVRDQQWHSGILLELGELLRDRRGAVGEGFGDRRQSAPEGEFVQQAQPAQFEHVGLLDCRAFIDEDRSVSIIEWSLFLNGRMPHAGGMPTAPVASSVPAAPADTLADQAIELARRWVTESAPARGRSGGADGWPACCRTPNGLPFTIGFVDGVMRPGEPGGGGIPSAPRRPARAGVPALVPARGRAARRCASRPCCRRRSCRSRGACCARWSGTSSSTRDPTSSAPRSRRSGERGATAQPQSARRGRARRAGGAAPARRHPRADPPPGRGLRLGQGLGDRRATSRCGRSTRSSTRSSSGCMPLYLERAAHGRHVHQPRHGGVPRSRPDDRGVHAHPRGPAAARTRGRHRAAGLPARRAARTASSSRRGRRSASRPVAPASRCAS